MKHSYEYVKNKIITFTDSGKSLNSDVLVLGKAWLGGTMDTFFLFLCSRDVLSTGAKSESLSRYLGANGYLEKINNI